MLLTRRIQYALLNFFRIASGRRYAPQDSAQRHERNSFTDLPPEILQYIIIYISDEWKNLRLPAVSQLAAPMPRLTSLPLVALSTVNRQLRSLCLPTLFRVLNIRPTGPVPPRSILRFAQYIHLKPRPDVAQWEINEEVILRTCQLTSIYWHGEGTRRPAQPVHLRLLLASSTLRSLTLSNVWLCHDGSDFTAVTSRLRTLRIDCPHQLQGGVSTTSGLVESHLACLNSLFDLLRPTLESLTLSGYSTKLSSLAAAPWPSLRVFSLTRGDAILDVVWDQFLGQTPSLSSLTIALCGGEGPIMLLPGAADVQLPYLRHLTISSPHPDDTIFSRVSPELRELSLRDSPRYYTVRTMPDAITSLADEPILSCSDVLRIFSVLSAANLNALELVYLEDAEEFRMLGYLARSCPNLTLLELHRYPRKMSSRDAWYYGLLMIPVEAIAESLAEFKSLRTLKLNLCFTDYAVGRTIPEGYLEYLSQFLEAQAHTVARRIPWVKLLSILSWSRRLMCWHTWSIRPGDDDEHPRLVYEDIYFKSRDGWADWDYF